MSVTNQRVYVKNRPDGMPTLDDFGYTEDEISEVPADHVLVKVDTLSVDAFIRTTLDAAGLHEMSDLGASVTALGVGEVVESQFDGLSKGDWVAGPLLAQTYALMPGMMFQKIEPSANIPPSTYLGILGMTTGLTAWAGLIPVGEVQQDDVVVVSGAAGAVGTVAAQLAKARGARVIGIAGGPDKCRFLTEDLGLAGAIDYKNDDVAAKLKELAPDGINVFFDNVGGEILDNVLDNLAMGARVVICGAISQYQNLEDVRGPKLYLRVAERNASMRGFTVDYYASQFPEAQAELSRLMTEGAIQLPEHIVEGIQNFPDALLTLFNGGHTGKMLVKP
ncbi:MAG: NADP-dependent oxidoreductase [Pseudomonadota bacterium]